jgi:hypothetical protein
MTVAEDSRTLNVNLTKLEEEIARFDSVLVRIQNLMLDNLRVYEYVVQTRDAIFRLQQAMRGLEIIEFAEPWLDPEDVVKTTRNWKTNNKEDHEF